VKGSPERVFPDRAVALSALALITIFIFIEGVPLIAKVWFFLISYSV